MSHSWRSPSVGVALPGSSPAGAPSPAAIRAALFHTSVAPVQVRHAEAREHERRRRPANPHARAESPGDAVRGLELVARDVRRQQVQRRRAERPVRAGGPLQVIRAPPPVRAPRARAGSRDRTRRVPARQSADDEPQKRLAGAPADLVCEPDRPQRMRLFERRLRSMNGVVAADWYDVPQSASRPSAFASPRRSSIFVNSATERAKYVAAARCVPPT